MGFSLNNLKQNMKKKGAEKPFNTNVVKVEIISFNDKIPRVVKVYEVKEKRDEHFNLKLTTKDKAFNEYVNLEQDPVISQLIHKYELGDMEQAEAITTVEDKIEEQKGMLRAFDNKTLKEDFPKIIIKEFNIEDERVKLEHLKVLLHKVKTDFYNEGIYVKIDKQGFRTYQYKTEEGVFYPMMYVDCNSCMTPAKDVRRKNFSEDIYKIDMMFKRDMGLLDNKFIKVMMILSVVLVAILAITNIETAKVRSRALDIIQQNNLYMEQLDSDDVLLIHGGYDFHLNLTDTKKDQTLSDQYIGLSKKVIG